jgi:hypothetical protein
MDHGPCSVLPIRLGLGLPGCWYPPQLDMITYPEFDILVYHDFTPFMENWSKNIEPREW